MARQKKPKTAYELLERVCEAIKAHPLNYYQGMWVSQRGSSMDPLPASLDVPDNKCGTAFCRAGWVCQLLDGAMPRGGVGGRSNEILGLSDDETDPLYYEEMRGAPGSKAYVQQGVRGVRAFMRQHAKHLKARSLRGV
jgi:hypothetical protein